MKKAQKNFLLEKYKFLYHRVLYQGPKLEITGKYNKEEKIDNEQMFVICEALKLNPNIEKIDLSHNNIGNEGIRYLSSLLGSNSILEKIDISHNKFNHDILPILRDSLIQNSCLKTLVLSGNFIGDKLDPLLNLFDFNSTLVFLDLEYLGSTSDHMKLSGVLQSQVIGVSDKILEIKKKIALLLKENLHEKQKAAERVQENLKKSEDIKQINLHTIFLVKNNFLVFFYQQIKKKLFKNKKKKKIKINFFFFIILENK